MSNYLKKSKVFNFVTPKDLIDTNMEKAHRFFTPVEINTNVFKFCLGGDFNECDACIKILDALDLNEHDIQFLCLKEHGLSCNNDEVRLAGLIEVKEGTTIDGMINFFRTLDNPFWHCISLVKPCGDVDCWLASCFEKKGSPLRLTLEKGGVVIKKGTLTC